MGLFNWLFGKKEKKEENVYIHSKEYYPNGKLKKVIQRKIVMWPSGEGQDEIYEMTTYYENGNKESTGEVVADKSSTFVKHDWWSEMNEDGRTKGIVEYKKGRKINEQVLKDGKWIDKKQQKIDKLKEKAITPESIKNVPDEYLTKEQQRIKASYNKEKEDSSNLSGDQKMLHVVYPKLKGIDFSKVKFGASGNSATEFFASDIDGDWHYAQSQMIMLFKAFSKDKIESELKLLLNQNEINLDDKIEKTELLAEHWKGDGFKIEHPVMEGIDIIIITNEDMIPEDSLTLQKTDLAPEVSLPTGYENIGIENVYDGSKFLKANQGQFSLNIPLLFKDNDESTHYIIIGVSTLTLAKRIIDEIIEKNYGKQYFKELDEKDGWQYIYANKFFTIGFLSKYHCVRINMLHNLVDIRQ